MARATEIVLFVCGLVVLCSCSTLPEYAVPKGELTDPSSRDMSDLISYRTLERADFKSDRPPPAIAPYVDKIGAATCARILSYPGRMTFEAIQSPEGDVRYEATLEGTAFEAKMDRKCSWWNPKGTGQTDDYLLEHEQIHFALFELHSRRMNASVQEIEARINGTVRSAEAATQRAKEILASYMRGMLKAVLARNRKFDEETSMSHNPDQQKRWWNLVHSELAETSD